MGCHPVCVNFCAHGEDLGAGLWLRAEVTLAIVVLNSEVVANVTVLDKSPFQLELDKNRSWALKKDILCSEASKTTETGYLVTMTNTYARKLAYNNNCRSSTTRCKDCWELLSSLLSKRIVLQLRCLTAVCGLLV
jgi:hypothetical protein